MNTLSFSNLTSRIVETQENSLSTGGSFGQRNIEEGTGTIARSWSSWIFARDYFLLRVVKYLTNREIMNLRLVSLLTCKALFEYDLFSLKITVERLKTVHQHFLPRLYPQLPPEGTVTQTRPVVFKCLQADAIVRDARELQRILADSRFIVKNVIFEGDLEYVNAVVEALPQNIEHFEMWDIPGGMTVDLSRCTHLRSIKVLNQIQGVLILPTGNTSGVTSFEWKMTATETKKGFYRQSQFIKVGDISNNIQLPANITSFEAGMIQEGVTLDLTSYEQLISVSVGDIYQVPLLPKNIVIFKSGNINPTIILDLSSYEDLRSLKVGNVQDIILPKKIVTFVGKEIGGQNTTLDWRPCEQLRSVKIEKIQGKLILPEGVLFKEETFASESENIGQLSKIEHIKEQPFETIGAHFLELLESGEVLFNAKKIGKKSLIYGNIYGNGKPKSGNKRPRTVDLSLYTSYPMINICDAVEGVLKLPFNVAYLFCQTVAAGVILDLSRYKNLSLLQVVKLQGELKLPSSLTRFVCAKASGNTILDLSQCPNLSSIRLKEVKGTIIFPSTEKLTSFEYGETTLGNRNALLDLINQCSNLLSLKLGDVDSTLILPSTQTLTSFECDYIKEEATLDLSQCPNLSSIKLGVIHGTLLLPSAEALVSFQCSSIFSEGELDLSQCLKLSSVKLGSISCLIKLPSTQTLTSFECYNIERNGALNLSQCTNLSSIKLGNISYESELPSLPSTQTLTSFECGNIQDANQHETNEYDDTIAKRGKTLNLSQYTSLSSIKLKDIDYLIKLPSTQTLTSFECGDIKEEATLDLSQCPNLSSLKIGEVRGTLILFSTTLKCIAPTKGDTFNLSQCPNLSSLKLLTNEHTHKPRPTEGTIKISSDSVSFTLELNTKYLKDLTLDLRECTNLSTLELPSDSTFLELSNRISLILSRQYHQFFEDLFPSIPIQWIDVSEDSEEDYDSSEIEWN